MSWAAVGAGVGTFAAGMLSSSGQSRNNVTDTDKRGWQQWTPPNAALPLYGQLAGNAGFMGQTPTPFFPGNTYVGPSAATQYGVNQGMGVIQNQLPWLNNIAGGNYGFLSNAADVANNPYVQSMLAANKQQVNQNFMENLLPQINSGAQQVNALGSTRHAVAQAQGAERTAQQLANANASTMLNAYGQGLGAQQSALGQLGNLQQAALMPAQAALNVGAIAEGYQQKALDDAMARYYHQYSEPWSRIGQIQGVLPAFANLGTTQGYGQGSSTQQNPNYVSPGQALGASLLTGVNTYLNQRSPAFAQNQNYNPSGQYLGRYGGLF